MSDLFACPKCGATYTREKRRIGKAVVCGCGHKFLVPPPEVDASPPTAGPVRSPPARANPKPAPARRRNPARASDSSGEVIAIPQPASRPSSPAPPPQARWAEPIEPLEAEAVMEAEPVMDDDPVMEAEVVYPAAGHGAAPAAADDLFGPSGAYGDPIANGNPYQPLPKWTGATPPATEPVRERRKKRRPRPAGISILAVLYILGGVLVVAIEVVSFAHRAEIEAAFRQIGVPPILALVGVTFVAMLTLAAGCGMWSGAQWGWWLGAYYQVYRLFCNATAIITVVRIGNELPAAFRSVEYQIFKHVARSIVGALVLMYFFKENVIEFFRLKRMQGGLALGILFGAGLAVTLCVNAIGYLAARSDSESKPWSQVPAAPPVSSEPAASGSSITIWDAKQRAGGVFSVEYRVDSALSPTGNYFWVINGPAGRVEFPIPGTTWAKQRQQLSGRAPAAGGAQLNGPFTCYVEEQVGGNRRRISNELPVGS